MNNIQQRFTMADRIIMVAFICILAVVAVPAYGNHSVDEQNVQVATQSNGMNMPMTEIYMTSGLI
jgi:Tfp pilus assembly major pilin PilA